METTAIEQVVPVTSLQPIVASLPEHLIVSTLPEQMILAVPAAYYVVVRATPAPVVSRAAVDCVDPCSTADLVLASSAPECICPVATLHDVVAFPPRDRTPKYRVTWRRGAGTRAASSDQGQRGARDRGRAGGDGYGPPLQPYDLTLAAAYPIGM